MSSFTSLTPQLFWQVINDLDATFQEAIAKNCLWEAPKKEDWCVFYNFFFYVYKQLTYSEGFIDAGYSWDPACTGSSETNPCRPVFVGIINHLARS